MKLYDDQLIVVTGAAGFIGSALVRELNDHGYKNLLLVDDLGTGEKWRNIVGKQFLDIISKHQLFNWLEGRESLLEAIVHLGACSSTVGTDAQYYLENNYRYTLRLAQYALRHDKRFVYASSAATYGDGKQGFVDDVDNLNALRPMNMYGYSKHLFDLWAKNEGAFDKIVGLKFFNVFGPNEYHKGRMASAVGGMVRSIQNEGIVRLFASNDPVHYGNGEQKRDFIYVKDVVRMIRLFLFMDTQDTQEGGLFNIGTGQAETWNSLARAVFAAMNRPEQIVYIEPPSDLKGYQNFTEAEMSKTRQALKQGAQTYPLMDSVADYVTHYLLPEERW